VIEFSHVKSACHVGVCGTHIVNTIGLFIPPCQPTIAQTSYHDVWVPDVEVTDNHNRFFPCNLTDGLQTVVFDVPGGCSVLSA
jgi:hypothetical protein